MLAIRYRARNAWLWVAFAAASMHQIEHLYLFWLYVGEHTVYLSGGAAGIMGKHGLIGSPLDRPYLHFTYNFIAWTGARGTSTTPLNMANCFGIQQLKKYPRCLHKKLPIHPNYQSRSRVKRVSLTVDGRPRATAKKTPFRFDLR